MNEEDNIFPLAYLITIRCYGSWLHGDQKGSVGRYEFNAYGSPRMAHSDKLNNIMRQEMREEVVLLN